jgi:transposase
LQEARIYKRGARRLGHEKVYPMRTAVGIDVSKDKLDVCVMVEGGHARLFTVKNDKKGHAELLRKCPEGAAFCMEATGAYHFGLAAFLCEKGLAVSVENPRRAKHYGLAVGALQKTDRCDARLIARHCLALSPAPWALSDPVLRELAALDRRLEDLARISNQEGNRLEDAWLPAEVRRSVTAVLRLLEKQAKALRSRMLELVAGHERLSREFALLLTVPGVGERAAAGLLAHAGDLASYDSAEGLAAKAGLHPVVRRSGTSVDRRTRISKAGSAPLRKRFYMPALVAVRHNPPVKAFYERLVARGKNKKAALVACERKLLMLCYGVVKSQRPFDPNHLT